MRPWFNRLRTVLVLLRHEHRRLADLFADLDESRDRNERRHRLARLSTELRLHTRLEDELFYPAFKVAMEGRAEQLLYWEAKQEHHVIDVLLDELAATDPATTDFAARARVLRELVASHMSHEERRLFPIAKREMTRPHLAAIAERLEERRAEILGSAHTDAGEPERQ